MRSTNMRSPLLIISLFLLMLSGCNTASNMTHEVSSWFKTDTSRIPKTNYAQPREVTQGMESPGTSPTTPVTSEPLDTFGRNKMVPAGAPSVVRVGLLLPLTGKNAALGKSFQDAAQMAVNDLSADNFELIPKDTNLLPGSAARAAIDEGAQLIIGPIFSDATAEVKTAVNGKVPVITLSNDTTLGGNNTYVFGFNPTQQVLRALQYAKTRNIQTIAILAPISVYGDIAIAAANASGIKISNIERYTSSKDSIKKAVAAISAKRGEIQGILLPDGGSTLANVATELTTVALSSHDIPIIGTGLWDEQDMHKYSVLVGGFYAAPDPAKLSRFIARFQKAYGSKPVRLASLAYDATAMAAVLAKQGKSFDEQTLTNHNGFTGLDGIFRLNTDGLAERGLAILEVTISGTRLIDASPKQF